MPTDLKTLDAAFTTGYDLGYEHGYRAALQAAQALLAAANTQPVPRPKPVVVPAP